MKKILLDRNIFDLLLFSNKNFSWRFFYSRQLNKKLFQTRGYAFHFIIFLYIAGGRIFLVFFIVQELDEFPFHLF